MSEPNKEFKISDEVWMRVVQIVQEGMITMTDVVDGLRMVRVTPDAEGNNLVLTEQYRKAFKEMQEQLVREAPKSRKDAADGN